MQVLVTGADGFIGKHMCQRLRHEAMQIHGITRHSSLTDLQNAAARADFVVHLAGINRPKADETYQDNANMTQQLADALVRAGKPIPVIYTSSTQVAHANDYGNSKKNAESILNTYGKATASPIYIYRLPNVFGPGARPNYNSAVATFCHRIAHGEAIEIHDPAAVVTLVYVDDVVSDFARVIHGGVAAGFVEIAPRHQITVGTMAAQIQAFSRNETAPLAGVTPALAHALLQTYRSAQPQEAHATHAPA